MKKVFLGLVAGFFFFINSAFAFDPINFSETLNAYGGFTREKGHEYGSFYHESSGSIKSEKQWVKDSMEGYSPIHEDDKSLAYVAFCLNSKGKSVRTILIFNFKEEKYAGENGVERTAGFVLNTKS